MRIRRGLWYNLNLFLSITGIASLNPSNSTAAVEITPPDKHKCPSENYHGNFVTFFVGAAHSATTTTDFLGELMGLFIHKSLGNWWNDFQYSRTINKDFWLFRARWLSGVVQNVTGLSTVEYDTWNRMQRFGGLPDIEILSQCFPKSLFILNARPLRHYLVTKGMWNALGRPMKSALCHENVLDAIIPPRPYFTETLATKIRRLILVREWYHTRVIDFFLENEDLQSRFFAIDATGNTDQNKEALRLCLALYHLDAGQNRILHSLDHAYGNRPAALTPGTSAASLSACHSLYSSSKIVADRIHRHVSPNANSEAPMRYCFAQHVNSTANRLGLSVDDLDQPYLAFAASRTSMRMALLDRALSMPEFSSPL